MKKQWLVALVLFLLIPVVVVLGGVLISATNPDLAAGHPNYARNWHLLNRLRITILWSMIAVAGVLWFAVCALVIRSKKRSLGWLPLAILGPVGFAILAMLNDREPVETDRYTRFMRHLAWPVRGVWEFCAFLLIWVVAYNAMVLKRTLMIRYESFTTGVPTAQIVATRDASGGMWAFSEGNEVMYFVILLYLLVPVLFAVVDHIRERKALPTGR